MSGYWRRGESNPSQCGQGKEFTRKRAQQCAHVGPKACTDLPLDQPEVAPEFAELASRWNGLPVHVRGAILALAGIKPEVDDTD